MLDPLRVLLTHPGTQHAPRLARELSDRGLLGRFATGLALSDDSILSHWEAQLPSSWRRRWENRRLPGVSASKVHVFPKLEIPAIWRLRHGAVAEDVMQLRNAAFQRSIPDEWMTEATHVIGFDTSSWLLAERSQSLGRPFILVQTIGHPSAKERVYQNIRRCYPDWQESLPEKPAEVLRCEDAEHQMASVIVAPSSFVRQTLIDNGVPPTKVTVINFGVDLELFRPSETPPPLPVVFLYAGALTARKGLPVLLEAWRQAALAPEAQLWLVGSGKLPENINPPEGVRFLGTVPQAELARFMRLSHCFVFPSMFEGLAKVQLEALACGLPVIGTRESGAEDILVPGKTGFVLPAGDSDQLCNYIRRFAIDESLRERMRKACIDDRGRLHWSVFGDRWHNVLTSSFQAGRPKVSNHAYYVRSSNQRPRVLLAHPGTQYSFHLARELNAHELLYRFYTGLGFSEDSLLSRFGRRLSKSIGLERQWENRLIRGVSASKLRFFPFNELKSQVSRDRSRRPRDLIRRRNEKFQLGIPNSELDRCDVVVGFDTSSYLLVERGKSRGKKFILDRSIAHPRYYESIRPTIKENYPEWITDDEEKSVCELMLEDREHDLADLIVVPSRFVADTLERFGVASQKIVVNPFGTDLRLFHPAAKNHASDKLIFLYVGALQARKGLPDLLESWSRLDPKNAELWIVGAGHVPSNARFALKENVRWLGRVSRRRLATIYQKADVFVFPSYFEGLAQVLVEAAACGLPIVTTCAAGGEEVVVNGETGYLVEAGNAGQLANMLSRFLITPGLALEMKTSRERLATNLSWTSYGARWEAIVDSCRYGSLDSISRYDHIVSRSLVSG